MVKVKVEQLCASMALTWKHHIGDLNRNIGDGCSFGGSLATPACSNWQIGMQHFQDARAAARAILQHNLADRLLEPAAVADSG